VPKQPERPPHAHLVGLLTFTSGCVDVVTLIAIGGAYTSIVTGNLVLVGRAIGTSSLGPALHVIMAIAGYALGVAAGVRLRQLFARRPSTAPWPRSATQVLTVECVILAAVNAAWIGYGATPPAAATDLMLVAAAVSLGMQGAAARAIEGNPSTTYMTGALTELIEALATGRRRANTSAVVGLLALVVGATCGALLVEHARPAALLPALASLVLVVVIKTREHHAERRAAAAAADQPAS
jgi:uncharacterized membrane protein YoaK (UPF0700 family)